MVYATKYMQRSKVIAFEYIQIMKTPISIERRRILEIRQYKQCVEKCKNEFMTIKKKWMALVVMIVVTITKISLPRC
jgi:phenylalanine-4-hydroxylase